MKNYLYDRFIMVCCLGMMVDTYLYITLINTSNAGHDT